jgi:dsRNA-specific ribonuclease
MSPEDVAAVEAMLGYEFGDKSLVEQALTHGSFYYPYCPGETYERLEYLGNGVLTCLMSREVFRSYHTLPTRRSSRASLSCGESTGSSDTRCHTSTARYLSRA